MRTRSRTRTGVSVLSQGRWVRRFFNNHYFLSWSPKFRKKIILAPPNFQKNKQTHRSHGFQKIPPPPKKKKKNYPKNLPIETNAAFMVLSWYFFLDHTVNCMKPAAFFRTIAGPNRPNNPILMEMCIYDDGDARLSRVA